MSLMVRLGSSFRRATCLALANARTTRSFPGALIWSRGIASAESSSSSFLPKDVVQDRVLEVIRTFPKVDSSKNDLAIDSLDQVELVMAFEDEFNIEITDEDAEKINNAEDAISYIAAHPMAK